MTHSTVKSDKQEDHVFKRVYCVNILGLFVPNFYCHKNEREMCVSSYLLTSDVGFPCFMGTFNRHNDYYTVQTVYYFP